MRNKYVQPTFYICFKCEYLGQVGVGKVEKIDLEKEGGS